MSWFCKIPIFNIGLNKKIDAILKQKGCEVIGRWEKSIINRLYWSVCSTVDGDPDVIKAKWLSLENHIHDVHQGHSDVFPQCLHGTLQEREWIKRRMTFILYFLWAYKVYCSLIHLDTKASERVTSLITNSALCKDICRLSPNYQTSSLESFHNVIIHFVSKSTAFSYQGMECRCMFITCT